MFRKISFIAGIMCLGFMTSTSALAGTKDILVVTGQTDPNGFTPIIQGNPAEYFYAMNVAAGTTVADTIPVQLALADTNLNGDTITVTLTAVGQSELANGITFSSNPVVMTAPYTTTVSVYINSTALTAGVDYHANVQINGTPADKVDVTHSTLHLLVHAVDQNGPIPPVCYITDSTGLLLSDCNGNPVQSGGEFYIITNQKKITATNPGQFYYNFVWTNQTGGPVTFSSVAPSGTNVVPVGTNSLHILIYDSTHFTASFDDVNTNGTPCGQVGTVCKAPITVPNGQTLWLTWHVAYSLLGSVAPGDLPYFTSCPLATLSGDNTISMQATLTGDLTLNCGAVTASGYTLK